MTERKYDFIVIGSGFGGSVSAYRLAQKGYRVLVVEKGRRFKAEDFSQGTTRPARWIWTPWLGMRGIMKLTYLRHVTIMSGVGVGGGSLVYGATLPTPKKEFFNSGSWANLQDWQQRLKPHYETALKMLGATPNPQLSKADFVLEKLAKETGRESTFSPTRVGIFFNPDGPGQPVPDPYFDGEGPSRRGCLQCGDCMTGCRYNAKNSLDKNYLYLAEKLGAEVMAETEVLNVKPSGLPDGSQGYFLTMKGKHGKKVLRATSVVFAGGVMGTVSLLLKLRSNGSLPNLSRRLGQDVRTNNESLTSVTALGDNPGFNDGVAIGSIFHPDENSHVEPIRMGAKSGLWRLMLVPMATGKTLFARIGSLLKSVLTKPILSFKAWFSGDFAGRTICLLFMQHLDSSISLKRGRFGQISSSLQTSQVAPSADIKLANELALKTERIIGGKAMRLSSEVFLGAPATAHILGGAVMGASAEQGVIDDQNRVFNYANMYVCDGSAVSANPGVNPSLTITAITEHAMSAIPIATPKSTDKQASIAVA